MNKKILLGIVALAIATVSVINVNFNSRSNNLSGVSLANVEALAQEGDFCPEMASQMQSITWEEIFYQHISLFDVKYVTVVQYTTCSGTGSICCPGGLDVVSYGDGEFVSCVH